MDTLQSVNKELTNSDELSAQEKLYKREARRRNILENAKNRLERLNGRTGNINTSIANLTPNDLLGQRQKHDHDNGPLHIDSGEFSDPEVEPDFIPQQLLQNDTPLDMANLFGSINTETTSLQQKRHILLRARLHIVISALVSCIFTFIRYESSTSHLSIFIPAGLCVIIDLLFFREQQPLNPVINLMITICNLRLPSQTKNILHLLSIIQSLIVDLGVFIFSFCVFSCSLVYINSSFIDFVAIK